MSNYAKPRHPKRYRRYHPKQKKPWVREPLPVPSQHGVRIRITEHTRRAESPLPCDRERRNVTVQIIFNKMYYWITGPRIKLQPVIDLARAKRFPHHWPLAGLKAVMYDPKTQTYSSLRDPGGPERKDNKIIRRSFHPY